MRLTCAACGWTGEARLDCAACGGLVEAATPSYVGGRQALESPASALAAPVAVGQVPTRGVWRFKALVDPELPAEAIVSLGEGDTPLVEAPGAARWAGVERLWIKYEGSNPTGSFKDRGMTVAVSRAVHGGARVLACASTGNTAASLAAYGARAGVLPVVLLPAGGVTGAKLAQALAAGARLLELGGDFDVAMALVRELAAAGEVALVNSANPFRLEGQKTLVLEVLQALGWRAPDWLAFPAGNLGNTGAFGKACREALRWGLVERAPRLLAVQAEGAAPFARAWAEGQRARRSLKPETVASAIRIGDPVSWERAVRALEETDGQALWAPDAELLGAQGALARDGLGAEPASCASVAGLRRAVVAGQVEPGAEVVAVLTGHLLKDPQVAAEAALGERPTAPPAPAGQRARRLACEPNLEALRAALRDAPR